MKRDLLIFALNNADNSYQAAILADQLGPAVELASPKVALPLDWVQENVTGPVKQASFAAANCNDPVVLDQIARRERRISVLLALASNPHLTRRTFDYILTIPALTGRTQAELQRQHYNAFGRRAEALAPGEHALFWDDTSTYDEEYHSELFVHKMLNLRSLIATTPNAPTLVLENELAYNSSSYALAFLMSHYVGTEFDDVWASVTHTPKQILDAHTETDLPYTLLTELFGAASLKTLVEADMIEALTEHLDPSINGRNAKYQTPKEIFSPAATLVLLDSIADEASLALLSYHSITDAQFTDLLNREGTGPSIPRSPRTDLFWLLAASRTRLEALVTFFEKKGTRYVGDEVDEEYWQEVLRCITDPNDELLVRLLPYSSEDTTEQYLSVGFSLTSSKTQVFPPRAAVPEIIKKHRESLYYASSSFHGAQPGTWPDDYVHALLDHTPGLASDFLDCRLYGAYVHARLTESGLDIDTVLTTFEKNQNKSLNAIADLLSKMAARTRRPALVGV